MKKQKIAYKTRHIRLSEEVWKEIKKNRSQSKLSWNLFIKLMNNEYKKK